MGIRRVVGRGLPWRTLDEDTIHSYVTALKKIFVIEGLPAWSPDLRTKGSIRTTDTRYFVDPSIAAAALGIGPGDLVNDVRSFGFFFESLAIRDLRVYMDALHGNVERYHDKTGLECDAVLHCRRSIDNLHPFTPSIRL